MTNNSIDPKDQMPKKEAKAKDLSAEDKKQSEKIISKIMKSLELFKDDRGNACARVDVNGHYENWPITTKDFRTWVAYQGRKVLGVIPLKTAVDEVITTLEGETAFNSTQTHALFNRVGFEKTENENKCWYDLADTNWSAVKITAKGWEIVRQPPILFKRYSHQLPQVTPIKEGNNIRLLDKYLRPTEEQDRILIYAFLVTSLIVDIPHACLILHGVQGSSKTTLFKMLRLLIDPSCLEVISLGTDIQSLALVLDHNWFCPFDNVSGLKRSISDIFCRVITESGFISRALYTNDIAFIRKIRRVTGINGINVAAVHPDLLERSILIELQAIAGESRRTEDDLWGEFEIDKAKIFGGMLDILSKALAIRPNVKINSKSRMADFMVYSEAIARAMGYPEGYFIKAYEKDMEEINAQGIEGDYVAATIKVWVENKIYNETAHSSNGELPGEITIWDGAPADLINELTSIAKLNKIITDEKDKFWPGKANEMSRHLNRIKPVLASEGILITTGERTAAGRRITIEYKNPGNVNDINNINNAGSLEVKDSVKESNLDERIMKDGDMVIDPGKGISKNIPTPPWKIGANKSQNDDHVDNVDDFDVSKIMF